MPKFEVVSVTDAVVRTAKGPRAGLSREYLAYISDLGPGQAGKLEASDGETTAGVRRRLGIAAKLAGKDVVIKRTGDAIYFWVRGQEVRRRGRSRKAL